MYNGREWMRRKQGHDWEYMSVRERTDSSRYNEMSRNHWMRGNVSQSVTVDCSQLLPSAYSWTSVCVSLQAIQTRQTRNTSMWRLAPQWTCGPTLSTRWAAHIFSCKFDFPISGHVNALYIYKRMWSSKILENLWYPLALCYQCVGQVFKHVANALTLEIVSFHKIFICLLVFFGNVTYMSSNPSHTSTSHWQSSDILNVPTFLAEYSYFLASKITAVG